MNIYVLFGMYLSKTIKNSGELMSFDVKTQQSRIIFNQSSPFQ